MFSCHWQLLAFVDDGGLAFDIANMNNARGYLFCWVSHDIVSLLWLSMLQIYMSEGSTVPNQNKVCLFERFNHSMFF